MKPFVFGLEKILKLRKHFEDEAKMELGRAIGILSELESRVMILGQERARAAAAQFSPGNSAVQIQQYMFYLLRLDNTKEQLLKETALAEMKVDEARDAYIEASRERKVLDNLKEKQFREYRKLSLSGEAKILDDISAGARARNPVA